MGILRARTDRECLRSLAPSKQTGPQNPTTPKSPFLAFSLLLLCFHVVANRRPADSARVLFLPLMRVQVPRRNCGALTAAGLLLRFSPRAEVFPLASSLVSLPILRRVSCFSQMAI
eukprot:1175772-Pleurochrysis_carterae.AAC.3